MLREEVRRVVGQGTNMAAVRLALETKTTIRGRRGSKLSASEERVGGGGLRRDVDEGSMITGNGLGYGGNLSGAYGGGLIIGGLEMYDTGERGRIERLMKRSMACYRKYLGNSKDGQNRN